MIVFGSVYPFLQVFSTSGDQDTITTQDLVPLIYARYIRVNPLTWTGGISLRLDFQGCTQDEQKYCE